MAKTKRVTLDLDEVNLNEAKKKAELLLSNFNNVGRVEIIRSSSGKGYHIIAYCKHAIPYSEQFVYRLLFGDCPQRLAISKQDYKRGENPDVLFTVKKTWDSRRGKYIFKEAKKIIEVVL